MNDVVICEPHRTQVGGYLGVLAGLPAADLATVVVREILRGGGEHRLQDALETMCIGGGQGLAAVFERVA